MNKNIRILKELELNFTKQNILFKDIFYYDLEKIFEDLK